ncbi:MAG: prepilin-type N-terminal cleavage/methylation domain-containing protein [Myxococcota bacterium]
MRAREGVTLVELLVVLALLGLLVGVSAVSMVSLRQPQEAAEIQETKRARREAIQSGTPRTAHGALFLPDGRAVGPGVDPLTGVLGAK